MGRACFRQGKTNDSTMSSESEDLFISWFCHPQKKCLRQFKHHLRHYHLEENKQTNLFVSLGGRISFPEVPR